MLRSLWAEGATTETYGSFRGFSRTNRDRRRRIILILIAVLLVILAFDLSASGAFARIAGPDTAPTGSAISDFSLRETPSSGSARIFTVKAGTRVRLVDSAGGEVLDSRANAPSKWYLVKLADGQEAGWAYSGWIKR